jgi:hypothetical protein
LHVHGKPAGLAVLAGLPRLVSLSTDADAVGIAELARLSTLRDLELTVAPEVSIAGLVDLPKLNLLKLLAGSRPLDDVTAATIAALARRKRKLRLFEHEGWPLQLDLPTHRTPGCVDIG